jgi:pyrroline-5-carboxylate reductase
VAAACERLDKTVTVCPPDTWVSGAGRPDAVVVAVKPADIATSLAPFAGRKPAELADVLWVSVAAGVSLERLESILGPSARICRVMPNTPALIGEGMSAYALSTGCKSGDGELAESILSACGAVLRVPEKLLNAVTGLSGSGPAYVYLFIEALIEGGVTAGLPYEVARQCAVQTVVGAGRMVQQSTENPGQLKARVMSPGGTTACGLLELEKNAFKFAVMQAVAAATQKSAELGK